MRVLADGNGLRFVIVTSNPWNTLTSLAAWRVLDPQRKARLQVVVVPHPVSGQAISDRVLAEALTAFRVTGASVVKLDAYPTAGPATLLRALARSLKAAREAKLVWISPHEPKSYVIREMSRIPADQARECGIVLSDDGLSFNKSLLTRSAHYWATGRRVLALTRPALDAAKRILTTRMLVMDARLIPNLPNPDPGQQKVLQELQAALEPVPAHELIGDAWFLSQPFEQDGNIPRGQYYGWLERQLRAWEREGLDVRVKLHPREVQAKPEWLPAAVLARSLPADQSGLPIELLLRHARPRVLVGVSSTSLLTIDLAGGIPAYSIPLQSLGVELLWHRAAILDTMKLLRRQELAPEHLAEIVTKRRAFMAAGN